MISSPKFYFFDPGIKRALDNTLNIELLEHTYAYGRAFEHFIITQIIFLCYYFQKDYRFFYLKTKDGAEIDLIIEKPKREILLIEIKSNDRSEEIDLHNLKKFQRDIPNSKAYCLSRDQYKIKRENVEFFPWDEGIEKIISNSN